tara:strand:- start:2088 stop:2291 length:204 start_codon:yes stop_codon:yes gene_type:complete
MNLLKEDLLKKREELENKYTRLRDAHGKKTHVTSEGAYRDTVKELREVYQELFEVAQELGDPIPVWF